VVTYTGCTDGADVVAIAVGGLGHDWPKAGNTGEWDGTRRIAEFLIAHPVD